MLKNFYGTNYYGAEDRYFHWQYKESVFAKKVLEKDEYSILVAEKNGSILALYAFLPWQTYVNGESALTFWTYDWLNVGKIKGLGREILSEIRSKCEILCCYGMNTYSRVAYSKMQYEISNQIERMLVFLDANACKSLFARKNEKERKVFIQKHVVPTKKIKHYIIDSINILSDNYWTNQIKRFQAIYYRGIDYLEWRFLKHPYLQYHIIAADQRGQRGIAVVRLEKIKYHPALVLRIVDLLPILGQEEQLAQAVISFGQKHGAILADFFCASSEYAKCLCPLPFVALKDHISYDIPMLFRPIEIRERKSINMAMDTDKKFSSVTIEKLYATKADGTQDVCLNEDYKTILL